VAAPAGTGAAYSDALSGGRGRREGERVSRSNQPFWLKANLAPIPYSTINSINLYKDSCGGVGAYD